MKHNIEYCLDETLKALLASWENDPRLPIEAEKLLMDFGLPNKHEFFKSLIRKLVTDKYAEYTDKSMPQDHPIKYYQEEVLITVQGVFHLDDGGYTKQKRRKTITRNNKLAKDVLHYLYYFAATAGIIIALTGRCSKTTGNCRKNDSENRSCCINQN